MKIFPEIEIPDLICRFDNYTQSTSFIQIITYILSFIGLIGLIFLLYKNISFINDIRRSFKND